MFSTEQYELIYFETIFFPKKKSWMANFKFFIQFKIKIYEIINSSQGIHYTVVA